MKKINELAIGKLQQAHLLQASKPEDRIFQNGLKITSPRIQSKQKLINNYLLYNRLLVQLSVLCRVMNGFLKRPMKSFVSGPW